jgi:acyl-CoA hydrolase
VLLADARLAREPGKRRAISDAAIHRACFARAVKEAVPSKLVTPIKRAPRELTAAEAAKLINPGDRVHMPLGHMVPEAIVEALVARASAPDGGLSAERPVSIFSLRNTANPALYTSGGKVKAVSPFLGQNTRDPVADDGDFIPIHFAQIPGAIREGKIPIDKAVVVVTPPDKHGFVRLGTTVAETMAALSTAKMIIAEINPNVPVTYGATKVHISRFNAVVRSEKPLKAFPPSESNEVTRRIALNVTSLVPQNPTVQFGAGDIADQVAAILAESGRKDLRIHTEWLSPNIRKLVEAGAVKGKIYYTFAQGPKDHLDWVNGNKKLVGYPVDVINNIQVLATMKRLVAVNSALDVDLLGQNNSQRRNGEWYSGIGGQNDFMRAAMLSKGGVAITALPATATVPDGRGGKKVISRIVPTINRSPGDIPVVTNSMHDVHYVVTEYGIAALHGKTEKQRAEALIGIAAPEFREELTRALEEQLGAPRRAVERRRQQAMAK